MDRIIPIAQVIVSLLLIGLILIQERSAGLSGLMGGEGGGFYQTRRGMERVAFIATIVLVVAFLGLALLQLFI